MGSSRAGPSRAGPGPSRVGPGPSRAVPSTSRAGLSTSRTGPSVDVDEDEDFLAALEASRAESLQPSASFARFIDEEVALHAAIERSCAEMSIPPPARSPSNQPSDSGESTFESTFENLKASCRAALVQLEALSPGSSYHSTPILDHPAAHSEGQLLATICEMRSESPAPVDNDADKTVVGPGLPDLSFSGESLDSRSSGSSLLRPLDRARERVRGRKQQDIKTEEGVEVDLAVEAMHVKTEMRPTEIIDLTLSDDDD